ncbi:U32 family peptidase [Desulfobacter hydrogenophilus]|uniref:U32 family peptidase n=1 Tax=Desulfobacter hydrogenophilus TaxID=2291 RepID=A0A328FDD7_9BACT|nr:U32 family peptidase [Desulfobacter hydrogenophilus]NDY71220.1 U32 family peptidase [Desulfobacter hydrogenophilus]QBH15039.1 U32 family peptidase [Desulfobacter hydrogenophilus]RAM02714.1 U32 family peptidase [Desulfobacter hydrogenophilus]
MPDLELLAPAKNMEFGKAAVDHGADAVYIGPERFGARAAAGNSVADIEALCNYAHRYFARVYVAFNTLLFDHELEPARRLIEQLYQAGVDALIIQDMGLLEMDLPPIPLFASTQTDNRTPEKVRFLEQSGFSRVILARELSLSAIKQIRTATRVDLEAFVHGALCVCYSGQCYMSAAIGGRSANRGACGQPCRLAWNLEDKEGTVLCENRHLLSLKDMNRAEFLGDLVRAGVTSFKIEGRLKSLDYVKNITGFYRQKLDALIKTGASYTKASSGRVTFFFTPEPCKTFNRGFTDYFLSGSSGSIDAFDTPKSVGEPIGQVKQIKNQALVLDRPHDLLAGDGICFPKAPGKLKGFYVNRVDGNQSVFPSGKIHIKKNDLPKGTMVFRNHDLKFARLMAGMTAQRKISLDMTFCEHSQGFELSCVDEDNIQARVLLCVTGDPARNPDTARTAIQKQLGKLGNTCFELNCLEILSKPVFLPAADLNRLRRDLVDCLEKNRLTAYARLTAGPRPTPVHFYRADLDFRANAANHLSVQFYKKRGVKSIDPAFECVPPGPGTPVMTTKHCIRRSLGWCSGKAGENRGKPPQPSAGPLFLTHGKHRFQVVFNCRECEMQIRTLIPGS